MSLPIRLAVISALSLLAVGCGGAKLDKDSASRIAGAAANKGNSTSAQGGLYKLMQQGDFEGGATASCTNGGTVSMKLAGVDLGGGLGLTFDLAYDECTEPMWDDPETSEVERDDVTQDGALTMKMDVTLTSVDFLMKGRLDLTGAVKDFVDMDVTQSMRFSATDSSVTFTQTINGTITTSEGTHTYDNETYRLTATGEYVKDGEA